MVREVMHHIVVDCLEIDCDHFCALQRFRPSDVKDCVLARMALHDVTSPIGTSLTIGGPDAGLNTRPSLLIVPSLSLLMMLRLELKEVERAHGPPAWTSASSARSVNSSELLAKGLTPSLPPFESDMHVATETGGRGCETQHGHRRPVQAHGMHHGPDGAPAGGPTTPRSAARPQG